MERDHDISFEVGPTYLHSSVAQAVDNGRRRVAERVLANADHSDLGAGIDHPAHVRGGAPVVRHLEDRYLPRRDVTLGELLNVACQQYRDLSNRGHHDNRLIVDRGISADGSDDLELDRSDSIRADRRPDNVHPAGGRFQERIKLARLFGRPGVSERFHRDLLEQVSQSTVVIEVSMGDHEQINRPDAMAAEPVEESSPHHGGQRP